MVEISIRPAEPNERIFFWALRADSGESPSFGLVVLGSS